MIVLLSPGIMTIFKITQASLSCCSLIVTVLGGREGGNAPNAVTKNEQTMSKFDPVWSLMRFLKKKKHPKTSPHLDRPFYNAFPDFDLFQAVETTRAASSEEEVAAAAVDASSVTSPTKLCLVGRGHVKRGDGRTDGGTVAEYFTDNEQQRSDGGRRLMVVAHCGRGSSSVRTSSTQQSWICVYDEIVGVVEGARAKERGREIVKWAVLNDPLRV